MTGPAGCGREAARAYQAALELEPAPAARAFITRRLRGG